MQLGEPVYTTRYPHRVSHQQAELVTDPTTIAAIHSELLARCFPSDTPIDLDSILNAVTAGDTSIVAILDDANHPLAFALGDHYPTARTVLLAYLAVHPDKRGQGLGTEVYQTALTTWRNQSDCMILAEVEDPAVCDPDPTWGDPEARLRFYQRHGARHLAGIPYFQPAMNDNTDRAELLLLACHVAPALQGPEGTESVSSSDLARFLRLNIEVCEGPDGIDPRARSLLRTARSRHGRILRPLPVRHQALAAA